MAFAEGGVLTDMEFVELADSFLGYSDPPPCRSLEFAVENEPALHGAGLREWSSLANQDCISAGAPAPMLPTGPIAPALHGACLSPSAGSSQDSLGHLESESSGRRREAQSNGGRAKRATTLAVKRSGSGVGKARGEQRGPTGGRRHALVLHMDVGTRAPPRRAARRDAWSPPRAPALMRARRGKRRPLCAPVCGCRAAAPLPSPPQAPTAPR
jgi:hypothetical protein